MQFINAIKNIFVGLYKSIKRFPVTILLSIAVAGMLIAISELQFTGDPVFLEMLNRTTMILALGIPLSLCIKIFWESRGKHNMVWLIFYHLVGAILLTLYYFLLLDEINTISMARYIGVNMALYLAFLFIPYLPHRKRFEMYIITIFKGFFITIFYAGVLFAGLAAIIFALDKLLGVNMLNNIYYYTWLLVVCAFSPAYFLAGIPLINDDETKSLYPKIIKVLFLYIVMPLLVIYTAILYAYFFKIILTQKWPIGLVSHLVLWSSTIAAIVLFFITPIKDENKWARTFFAWFPKIIIPILIMMFFSMGIRVKAYGITENRYYVILLGLWIFGVMIYFSSVKKTKNIIPFTALSIIALIAVFGPLSSFSISRASQNSRLKGILENNNMINEDRVLQASETISSEDMEEISRILDYFENNHGLDYVKYVPQGFKKEDMEKVFGFTYKTPQYEYDRQYIFFEVEDLENPVDVRGYDYIYTSMGFMTKHKGIHESVYVEYDERTHIINIVNDDRVIYSQDLKTVAKEIIEKHASNLPENTLSKADMTLTEENEDIKVKFMFLNIDGVIGHSYEDIEINNMEFNAIFELKDSY